MYLHKCPHCGARNRLVNECHCDPKNPPESVLAGLLAAAFAKEIGLPAGNLWEPVVARQIASDLSSGSLADVERDWRTQLGLEQNRSEAA